MGVITRLLFSYTAVKAWMNYKITHGTTDIIIYSYQNPS